MSIFSHIGRPWRFAFPLLLSGFISYPALAADAAALLAGADPSRVDKLLSKCARCHGDGGVSDDPEIPHLVAQQASYLYKQLQHFKAGERDGGRMNKMIRKIDDQQLADLAVHFAAQALPGQGVSAGAAPDLVNSGDQGRGIESCASCHGDDGRGKQDKYDAPALAGMPLTYFATSIESFADGSRQSDVEGVMGKVARALTAQEIQALASYYLAHGGRNPL